MQEVYEIAPPKQVCGMKLGDAVLLLYTLGCASMAATDDEADDKSDDKADAKAGKKSKSLCAGWDPRWMGAPGPLLFALEGGSKGAAATGRRQLAAHVVSCSLDRVITAEDRLFVVASRPPIIPYVPWNADVVALHFCCFCCTAC